MKKNIKVLLTILCILLVITLLVLLGWWVSRKWRDRYARDSAPVKQDVHKKISEDKDNSDPHGFPIIQRGQLPSCFLSKHVEEGERHVASMFTRPNACVLELGGDSGAVSVIVQQMLKNKGNHVVVQPKKGEAAETPMYGGIDNLSKNKKACQCEYHIIDHVFRGVFLTYLYVRLKKKLNFLSSLLFSNFFIVRKIICRLERERERE